MPPAPTERLYLHDDHLLEADATVVAVREDAVAVDRTCFYPGGGGQPPDDGSVSVGGDTLAIVTVRADGDDVLWHVTPTAPPAALVGAAARLRVNRERREALARYHTVLHVVNTIALRDHGGLITGVQIAVDYARIDFTLGRLSAALCAELETRVNAVLDGNHALRSYCVAEAEFRGRGDLLRTLDAAPPVIDGRVRVVEIDGFDAQACGGTHVRATGDVGRLSITRTENKGRLNKRLYVRLGPPTARR